jgi:hypothetical protein
MRIFSSKRRVALAGAVAALVLAGGGSAFAYFTAGSSASGTGQGAVGTAASATWSVSFVNETGTMLPGSGTATLNYLITNTGAGSQALTSVVAAIAEDASTPPNIEQHGVPLMGCQWGWYALGSANPTPTPALGTSIAPGGTATVAVTMTMINEPVIQNVCEGATPDVTLTVE